MSVYNLRDEGKLGLALSGVEGLNFEKVGIEFCNGEETVRYHVTIDEVLTSGQFLGSMSKFVQENEGTKVRFYNPAKTGCR